MAVGVAALTVTDDRTDRDADDSTGAPVHLELLGLGRVVHGPQRSDRLDAGSQGAQTWTVLAVLALAHGGVAPRHHLADALWPDRLPASWESALRNVTSRLRLLLRSVGVDAGDAVARSHNGWALRLPEGSTVDVLEAEALVLSASRHVTARRLVEGADAAHQAQSLLSRPLLHGVDGAWVERTREHLRDQLVAATEVEARARLELGMVPAAVAAATALVRQAPDRESSFQLLISAHAAAGDRSQALLAYERCRRMLLETLGVDPSPATQALYLELLG